MAKTVIKIWYYLSTKNEKVDRKQTNSYMAGGGCKLEENFEISLRMLAKLKNVHTLWMKHELLRAEANFTTLSREQ